MVIEIDTGPVTTAPPGFTSASAGKVMVAPARPTSEPPTCTSVKVWAASRARMTTLKRVPAPEVVGNWIIRVWSAWPDRVIRNTSIGPRSSVRSATPRRAWNQSSDFMSDFSV